MLRISTSDAKDVKLLKRAFLLRAKEVHPDTIKTNADEGSDFMNKKKAASDFIKLKDAFQYLLEEARKDIQRNSSSSSFAASEFEGDIILENFDHWFDSQHDLSTADYIHPIAFHASKDTIKEMIGVSKHLERGGLDRGGMWDLVDTMANNSVYNESDKDNHRILSLEEIEEIEKRQQLVGEVNEVKSLSGDNDEKKP